MNAKTDTEHAAIETTLELACRASGGMRVLLLWDRAEDRISVVVDDARTGESFELPVHDRSQALDVFRHPFAHAGSSLGLAVSCGRRGRRGADGLSGDGVEQDPRS